MKNKKSSAKTGTAKIISKNIDISPKIQYNNNREAPATVAPLYAIKK